MLLCSASLCSGQNVTDDNVEASKVGTLLLQSSSSTSTTAKPPTSATSPLPKAKSKQAHEIEEDDKNFSNDRLPELTDAEYSSLGEDANPLHFLKQQQPQSTNPQPKPEPLAMPQPSASSIYITIPIYINAAGKLPLTLAIGDQQMSLNQQRKSASANKKSPHTKAPNSHFNRLLEQIETTPKRRVTNRHRSQLKSNIQAAIY